MTGATVAGFATAWTTTAGGTLAKVELVVFAALVLGLIWGGLVYQLARAGAFRRVARSSPLSREELEGIYDRPAAPLAVLIPSYREEVSVLRHAIVSAALMEHPNRRVVVLVDDPPLGTADEVTALARLRREIVDLNLAFAQASQPFEQALERFKADLTLGNLDRKQSACALAAHYRAAAEWLTSFARKIAAEPSHFPHTDRFFFQEILEKSANDHRSRAEALLLDLPDVSRLAREHRRVASMFRVEIASFERKRYANLSHAPNKAMNLNAYIGLIGGFWRAETGPSGTDLVLADSEAMADIAPRAADYLLTLDADSVVLGDYALKLIPIMEADPSMAVAQTPYSAFPGAPGVVERISGATTDLQYIVHQGFTAFKATYWVGANALLRLTALRDIARPAQERGHVVQVFIQDQTVIEDTGSTIDLVRRGWRLHNYPERLSYSATPSDFGSLVVQRVRWANGGLIIFRSFLAYFFGVEGRRARFGEAFMRAHYLLSPAVANFGLLVLLVFPFDTKSAPLALPFTALGYYVLYGRDLMQQGYRGLDLVRVYALNLVLLPVNLAGVAASLRQLMTGQKSAFGRTPKVGDRTRAPARFVLLSLALLTFLAIDAVFETMAGHTLRAVFAAINGVLLLYGHSIFIGWRETVADIAGSALRRPVRHETFGALAPAPGAE